jgi:hypothetical protein
VQPADPVAQQTPAQPQQRVPLRLRRRHVTVPQ